MRKGISPIIATVLLLMIAISVTYMASVWLSSVTSETGAGTSKTMKHALKQLTSCIRIESMVRNKIYLRNCGDEGVIKESSIGVYLNGNAVSFTLDPAIVDAGKVGTIRISKKDMLGYGYDVATVKVSMGAVTDAEAVEMASPTGVVILFPFDEGSGTIAKDLVSGATLTFGTGDKWVDGVDDSAVYVSTGWWTVSGFGTHPVRTISFWFKVDNADPDGDGTFICFSDGTNTIEIGLQDGKFWYNAHFSNQNHYLYDSTGKDWRDNKWHHVVVIQDSSGTKIYVDDMTKPLLEGTATAFDYTSITTMKINGGCGYGRGNFLHLNGIDEIYVSSDILSPENAEAGFIPGP